jgi:hypothetical protein
MEVFQHCVVKEVAGDGNYLCVFIIFCLFFSVGGLMVSCKEGLKEVIMYEGKKSFRTVKMNILNE